MLGNINSGTGQLSVPAAGLEGAPRSEGGLCLQLTFKHAFQGEPPNLSLPLLKIYPKILAP